MTVLGYVLGLAAVWVMLWGSPSPANVLSGLAVGGLLVMVLPGLRSLRSPPVVRPVAVARLAWFVLSGVFRSNLHLSRAILTPRGRRLRTALVSVTLPPISDELATGIANLLALSPGTMPLEVRLEDGELIAHVLYEGSLEDSTRNIEQLVAVCVAAFGETDTEPHIEASADGSSEGAS